MVDAEEHSVMMRATLESRRQDAELDLPMPCQAINPSLNLLAYLLAWGLECLDNASSSQLLLQCGGAAKAH